MVGLGNLGTPEAPLFCAADVCGVLGLSNASKSTDSLDADELVSLKVTSGGQGREMLHVTESGLYHLIFKSRKAAAKRFRRWVTEEVLPEIRRNGVFHAEASTAGRDLQRLPLTAWLSSLGLDLRDDAKTCGELLNFVNRASQMLRWFPNIPKSRHPDTMMQEVPVSVLDLAEGLWTNATTSRRIASPAATMCLPSPCVEAGGSIHDILERRRQQGDAHPPSQKEAAP